MVFPIVKYGCESWAIKKAEHQRTNAFELWCWRSLESPLDCKEIKPINAKGNQSWIFIGRTDAEAEAPVLWLSDVKNRLIWKDPHAGKDWRQEEKGMTEDEMPSPPWWTWVWTSSRSWWWTGKPGVLQSMGSQRVGHDWATEVKWLATPWTVARQSLLSSTISQSLLKLISIELVMPPNHLILYCPLHLLPSIFPSISIFSNELALRIRQPKDWSFSFSISPSSGYSGSLKVTWYLFLLATSSFYLSLESG